MRHHSAHHRAFGFLFPAHGCSVQFSHLVMSDSLQPHDRSTPGLPVHHQLPESTQTHVHRVGDAIQPSHPLSSPSPPAPNPSHAQHNKEEVTGRHCMAKMLETRTLGDSGHFSTRGRVSPGFLFPSSPGFLRLNKLRSTVLAGVSG